MRAKTRQRTSISMGTMPAFVVPPSPTAAAGPCKDEEDGAGAAEKAAKNDKVRVCSVCYTPGIRPHNFTLTVILFVFYPPVACAIRRSGT